MIVPKPKSEAYNSYFKNYIDVVASEELYKELVSNLSLTATLLSSVSEEQAGYRYQPDKWSVKELLGHIIDCERIFNYRALTFAREPGAVLPGFDHDAYVRSSQSDARKLSDMLDELRLVRHATIRLFQSFEGEVWDHGGIANGNALTVRACAYIICGHELHHIHILKERYLS